MRTIFSGKKITGILSILPQKEVSFNDEIGNYSLPSKQTLKLKNVMGFEKHRIVHDSTATSDLCVAGLQYLLDNNLITKDEIGGIIVVTTTPDHLIPPVSNIIHGKFGFDKEVVCLDISQGCVAFLIGLMQAFMLLDRINNKKMMVFTADVLSKRVSQQDRNSYPLIGDGAAITIVENDLSAKDIFFISYNDGSRRDALIIPAGGSRLPCSIETSIRRDIANDGNLRALDNLTMNGSDVFTFVQTEVPPLIEETVTYAGKTKSEIDWFLFHQPNKFMLKKLAERLGVPYEKVPMNIVENYGNPSGASIPFCITHNLSSLMKQEEFLCCLSAFGSGLSWAAMVLELGKLDFCEMLISDC
ncbi:MAG: ketoacyl-ACP synthase III [Flexilinea sp.]